MLNGCKNRRQEDHICKTYGCRCDDPDYSCEIYSPDDRPACLFCQGKPISGTPVGNGIDTFHTMISKIFGGHEEQDQLNNGIQLLRGNVLCADSSSMEYNPIEIEINYCPFCGRELKGESE